MNSSLNTTDSLLNPLMSFTTYHLLSWYQYTALQLLWIASEGVAEGRMLISKGELCLSVVLGCRQLLSWGR